MGGAGVGGWLGIGFDLAMCGREGDAVVLQSAVVSCLALLDKVTVLGHLIEFVRAWRTAKRVGS